MYGNVGDAGTKILIEKKYSILNKYYTKQYLDKMYDELCDGENAPSLFISGINKSEEFKYIIDKNWLNSTVIDSIKIGKGGVLAALWKITERNKMGIEYKMAAMPINQVVVEITNFFNINPYRLYSNNSYLLVLSEKIENNINVQKSNYSFLVDIFYNFKLIANSINSKKKIRIDNDSKSYLTRCYKDELEVVLPNYLNDKIC